MNTYLHYAKSAYLKDNIQNKLDIGTDGIEIQLLNVKKDLFWSKDWLSVLPQEQLDAIRIIHMPLTKTQYRDEFIENNYGIESKMGSDCFERVIERVLMLMERTLNQIGIVSHIELPDTVLKRSLIWPGENSVQKTAWDVHVNKLRELAAKYPQIMFYIENATLIESPLTSYRFVKEISRPNVKMCIDTCHLMMCQYAAKVLNDAGHPYYSIKDYFKMSRDYVGMLHFCGAADTGSGYGYGKGHGCVTDIKTAYKIYKILNKYNIVVPLTLEVREKDYTNCKNYESQLKICKAMESII